ncbi:PQQ-dependent sugar dehydrogenase [Aliikangiella marina]|uniref:PQQ-dependent sugar dehydrogenase n=1 Tax=Aliikangiella marina TaxID=1712262 RepID=A0A545T9B8_9GAMM|nr:PQQ-dependent sugar dehydrogenase [Aliikangiella marina]TQV73798.1 PQQ-dependent sugar dehydrogenase [Aliikangiella marina]
MNIRKTIAKRIAPIFLVIPFSIVASEKAQQYEVETVVTGVAIPWGMTQVADGKLLITDRSGTLYLADPSNDSKVEVSGLPKVSARGQGGLLDVELHPDYKNNGWIYFSYASPEGEGKGDNTAIIRAKLKGTKLENVETVYKASPNSTRKHHYGSRIEFDNEGYLYFTIGDRGERDVTPQDLTVDGGKVYRIHDDGKIPADNPFVNTKGAKPATYSYGHRNPQGMGLNPQTGKIWVHEHGPKGGDEINVVAKGKNYGWPVISYGVNYSGTKFTDITEKEGMEQPAWYWVPSIAPSGMAFVTSDKYPTLKGQLLIGSLKFGTLVAAQIDGDTVKSESIIVDNLTRIRNVQQLADGYIYIATDMNKIVRLKPKS